MHQPFFNDLSQCKTGAGLATALGLDLEALLAMAAPDALKLYQRHGIPKRSGRRSGQVREVFEPATDELKHAHRTIHRRLSDYASRLDPNFPPACCFGFVRHRSTLDNARQHLGHRLLLRADIADFFPSITRARVEQVFLVLGLSPQPAELLSHALCFTGALVPGLSASPLVANLVCRSLDARLLALAAATDTTYTRYADDIAFSGDAVPGLDQVAEALHIEGFRLTPAKQRLTKRGQAHFVTGLSIQDTVRPHVPKKMKRRLRQELYYCSKFSVDNHLVRTNQRIGAGINRLDGMVRYVSHVEKGTSFDFRQTWRHLQTRDDVWPSVRSNHAREARIYFVAVDETLIETRGRRFLAVAFALYEDEVGIQRVVSDIRNEYLEDTFSLGRKEAIRKRGLHYSDAHASLRGEFIAQLPAVPVRVLVGYVEIDALSDEDKGAAYSRIFVWAVPELFNRADNGKLVVRIEDASFINKGDVAEITRLWFDICQKLDSRRPATFPDLSYVNKNHEAVALPDFMLGVLREYVQGNDAQKDGKHTLPVEQSQFERVRDRFTLIHDLDTARRFSRHNPFLAESIHNPSLGVATARAAPDDIAPPQAVSTPQAGERE